MGNTLGLRKNEHFPLHTQAIVEGADIGIRAWLAEGDPEASYSGRCLRKTDAILGSCLEKARVHTIGGGIEHAVSCTVGVDGYETDR
jgi:hypothetical protein